MSEIPKLATEDQLKSVADTFTELYNHQGKQIKSIESGIIDTIVPASPAPTKRGQYVVSEPGIYVNFKDSNKQSISVTEEEFTSGAVYLIFNGSDSRKVVVPIEANGEVREGDKRPISGSEVYKSTAMPLDIGLQKLNSGDNLLKYADFNNSLEFLKGWAVSALGNYVISANWSSTNQPINPGDHPTNIYLTASTALVTLDKNGNIVNSYTNKGSADGLAHWSFSSNEEEVMTRYCIHKSQLTKGQPNSAFILTSSGYIKSTSSVFVSSDSLKPDLLGVNNFTYHSNIFQYSDFNNNLEFVPNTLVTALGSILLGNNYKMTRQPLRKGNHVSNIYLTPSIALVTLDKDGNVVNSYTNKGSADGLTPWNFSSNDYEVEFMTPIHNSQLTKGQLNSVYITAAANYQIVKPSQFQLNQQSYLNKDEAVLCGDSTVQYGEYDAVLSKYLGIDFKNCGVGGTNLTNSGSSVLANISFCKIADAINTGDFTGINNALDELISTSTGQTQQRHRRTKTNINSINWGKVKYLIASFGTNDYASSRMLGNVDLDNFDNTTIVGAINYAIEKIQTKYPNIQIFFVTPTHRFLTTDYVREQDSDFRLNAAGLKLIDYVNTIKVTANLNHIACKDMYSESGLNRFNHSNYFADGVHPNSKGFEHFGKVIASFIKSKIEV